MQWKAVTVNTSPVYYYMGMQVETAEPKNDAHDLHTSLGMRPAI